MHPSGLSRKYLAKRNIVEFGVFPRITQNTPPKNLILSSSVGCWKIGSFIEKLTDIKVFFCRIFWPPGPRAFPGGCPMHPARNDQDAMAGMLWTRIPNRKRMFYVVLKPSTQELGKLAKNVGPKHPWALKATPCGNEKQLLTVRWRTYQCAHFLSMSGPLGRNKRHEPFQSVQ